MKITYIVPGTGGKFYCGNCLRDSIFIDGLKDSGHDITVMPMYLPISAETCVADTPVFFGAVNIYLKQLSPIFKWLPRRLQQWLDSSMVLRYAAKKSGTTTAKGMGKMTVSMLKGEAGRQKEELHVLADWLAQHEKPDVIHLSNALLLGLAPTLRERVNDAIICTLQDEDVWVNGMDAPYPEQTWELIRENSRYVDAFITPSQYYKNFIADKMADDKTITQLFNPVRQVRKSPLPERFGKKTIGFLSPISANTGADILVDALMLLNEDPQTKDIQVHFFGGYTGDYQAVLREMQKKIKKNKLKNQLRFYDQVTDAEKQRFFDGITAIASPSKREEAFGTHLTESLAQAIPIIVPKHGAYTEIIQQTGAGILYEPNDAKQLAATIQTMLADKAAFAQYEKSCLTSLTQHLNMKQQTEEVIKVYQKAISP